MTAACRGLPLLAAALGSLLGITLLGPPALAVEDVVAPQVVNGRLGDPREHRNLVVLASRSNYEASGLYDAQVCGGSAATSTIIITAAHCVRSRGSTVRPSSLVVASTPSGELSDPDAQVVRLDSIVVYDAYDSETQRGDIAVLHLAEPLTGIEPLLPALPAEASELAPAGGLVQVAGWGATTADGDRFPDGFRVGDLTMFPRSACGGGRNVTIDGVTFSGYGSNDVDPTTMVCAEGVRGDRVIDSCIGDSGGPLTAGEGEQRRLIGVVSWGPERCASRYSGVYTRVSAFSSFLREQGVPFAPTPTNRPLPPTIITESVTPDSATITVQPSADGTVATSISVTARDRQGKVRTCTMPTEDLVAVECTLTNLTLARRYTVTAVALNGTDTSEPSEAISVKPADRPSRPRIDYAEPTPGGAVFGVSRVRSNGSPLTKRVVVCLSPNAPKRKADIAPGGLAEVAGLRSGVVYTCRAKLANALGSSRSSAVTLRAN